MFSKRLNPVENRLLAMLPQDEYATLLSKLAVIQFPRNRILYETGRTIHHVYFVNTGMVSVITVGEDGRTIQIAAVGNEGFVGAPILLAGGRKVAKMPARYVTQTPVQAARISTEQLFEESNIEGNLRNALLRYSQVLETQLVQSGICNAIHTVRQRLCRWLLVSSDYIGSDTLDLTQQHLADMLGKHLNQVGRAAFELQKSRLIRYAHGRITILSRKGLESAACECYRIVRKLANEILEFNE